VKLIYVDLDIDVCDSWQLFRRFVCVAQATSEVSLFWTRLLLVFQFYVISSRLIWFKNIFWSSQWILAVNYRNIITNVFIWNWWLRWNLTCIFWYVWDIVMLMLPVFLYHILLKCEWWNFFCFVVVLIKILSCVMVVPSTFRRFHQCSWSAWPTTSRSYLF